MLNYQFKVILGAGMSFFAILHGLEILDGCRAYVPSLCILGWTQESSITTSTVLLRLLLFLFEFGCQQREVLLHHLLVLQFQDFLSQSGVFDLIWRRL